VLDTKVVGRTVEPQFTFAPFTNPVPLIVIVKLAVVAKLSGVTAIIFGIALSIVTEPLAEALALVVLTALIVT
jgi:hypothetical protein